MSRAVSSVSRTVILCAGAALALTLAGCPSVDPGYEPTLSNLQREFFGPSCGYSSCHGGDEPDAGLDLSSREATIATALDVDCTEVEGVRVVPGDPEASMLYRFLVEDPDGDGPVRQMPPVGEDAPAGDVEAVRRWIEQGAPLE